MQLEQPSASQRYLAAAVKNLRSVFDALRTKIDSALGSPTAVELFWWHVALIVPTIGFKYLYVRRLSFTTGLRTILESMGDGIDRYLNLVLLLTVDVLEVSLIVGLLYIVGRLLLRLPVRALMFASVFLCLLIMGVNQYSLLLVASLVTVDTFAISAGWAIDHPYVVWQSLGAPQLGFIALAFLWSAVLTALASRAAQVGALLARLSARSYPFFLKLIVLGSVLGLLTVSRMSAEFPAVLRGYWSSSLVSFFKLDAPRRAGLPGAHPAAVRAEYERLVYPRGRSPKPQWLAAVAPEKRLPRHVLIVTLETAPLKYYPLADNPALPVFYKMSKQAIVSDRHYAMSPYTWWNNASILSGTYFVHKGRGIFDYGDFETDSLASILARRGYITTFVESSKHGWGRTTGFWANFGFAHLLDSDGDAVPFARKSYTITADKERQSFDRALKAILQAEERQSKAMVLLATTLGHYPWLVKPGEESGGSGDILFGIAALFDQLFGSLLAALEQQGLADQVLIVVTGDHGFRMRTEFESVGSAAEYGDLAFNVPFLLYAPALFDETIRLPHATSHVDIAPTLLALMGIEDNSWLHHGAHMLDLRLRDRVTFMMNTNLSPVSGFRWNGCHYALNDFTGRVQVIGSAENGDAASGEAAECERTSGVLSETAVKSKLETASRLFDETFKHFQKRRTGGAKAPAESADRAER
jgi:hypothetical protein